ncbi:MAG TPA: TetR/AcrR family transcriptional regulator [Acidimicrobiales bacterium]
MASDTRDRLIRATSRLLRTQGYAATGLNQVMAEAKAPKGSMYFHFPGGKEELAAAALDHFAARSTARLRRTLAEHPTVADAVAATLDGYVEHLGRTGYAEGCAVATVALDAAASHAALADATDRAMRAWTTTLAEALRAEGRSADDAERLATLVIATLEGTLVMAKAQHSTRPIATARDALRTLLAPEPAPADR